MDTLVQHLLRDPHDQVRMMCVAALRSAPDTLQKVDAYIAALKDPHYQVVFPACIALGRYGDMRAVEPLRAVINHQVWIVRFCACEALVRLNAVDEPVVSMLETLHRDPEAQERNESVRRASDLHEKAIADGLVEPSVEPQWDGSTGAVLALARRKLRIE